MEEAEAVVVPETAVRAAGVLVVAVTQVHLVADRLAVAGVDRGGALSLAGDMVAVEGKPATLIPAEGAKIVKILC